MSILIIGHKSESANTVDLVGWDEIQEGKHVNISDYEYIFIETSSLMMSVQRLSEPRQKYTVIEVLKKVISDNKLMECIKAGTHVYFFGEFDRFLYGWFPNFIDFITYVESGKTINVLDRQFKDYFNSIEKYSFYFKYERNRDSGNDYDVEFTKIAENRVHQALGVRINFKELTRYRNIAQGLSLFPTDPHYKDLTGSLTLLPSLSDSLNSVEGIFLILEKVHKLRFTETEPEWSKSLHSDSEKIIIEELTELDKKDQELQNKITHTISKQQALHSLNELLWRQGHELEQITHEVLNILGFKTTDSTKSDHDGIMTYGKKKFMLEIKSSKGGQASFEQLAKLVTRITSHNKNSKNPVEGIFIMNHFANVVLEQRDRPFPPNVKSAARDNNIYLISTQQLYDLTHIFLAKQLTKSECQQKFFELAKQNMK